MASRISFTLRPRPFTWRSKVFNIPHATPAPKTALDAAIMSFSSTDFHTVTSHGGLVSTNDWPGVWCSGNALQAPRCQDGLHAFRGELLGRTDRIGSFTF